MNHYETIRDLIAPLGTSAEIYEPEGCPGQGFVRFPVHTPVEVQQAVVSAAHAQGWERYGGYKAFGTAASFSITFHAQRNALHYALHYAQEQVEELKLELDKAVAKEAEIRTKIAEIPSHWPDWVSPYGNL